MCVNSVKAKRESYRRNYTTKQCMRYNVALMTIKSLIHFPFSTGGMHSGECLIHYCGAVSTRRDGMVV